MTELIRAAGGVVLDTTTNTTLVLVVHRPDYDDWSLPKGKLDPGEDDQTAARREVAEETGVEVEILRAIGTVDYVDGRGRPKTVRYFEMRPLATAARTPDDEVDLVEWWPVPEAVERLTYGRDRALLASVIA